MKQRLVHLSIAAGLLGFAGHAAAAEIVIGGIAELTGSNASVGNSVARGSQIGAEWLNSRGEIGGHKVKLLVEDDGTNKAQALTLFNKFALRDNVSVVLGTSSSILAATVAPRAEELKVPTVTIAYSAPIEGRTWMFKTTGTIAHQFKSIAEYAGDVLKPKTCVRVWAKDNEATVQIAKIWGEVLRTKGVTLLEDTSVALADTDYSAAATKIVAQKPDCVFLTITAEAEANFIHQLKAAGLPATTKILGDAQMSTAPFAKAAGAAAEGIHSPAEYSPGGVNELGRQFEVAYRAKFGEAPDTYAALGFSQMLIVGAAIKASGANPTRESIRDGLAQVRELETVIGRGKLSMVDRIAQYDMVVLTVKGGKFVPAAPH